MSKWPVAGHEGAVRSHGVDLFMPFFGVDSDQNSEEQTEQEARSSFTASLLRLIAQETGANVPVTFRKNGADGNQTININLVSFAEFQDSTNTDDLVSGDEYTLFAEGSLNGMHGDTFQIWAYQTTLDSSSDLAPIANANPTTSEFEAVIGNYTNTATPTNSEYTHRTARTLTDLVVFVTTAGASRTFHTHKNGSNGNLTVSTAATGQVRDTSNSDSFVDGDEWNWHNDRAATGVQVSTISVETDSNVGVIGGGGTGAVTSTTSFIGFGAGFELEGETKNQSTAEGDATVQNLYVKIVTHAETRNVRTRKNQSNGNVIVSVTGTGVFEDTTNTDDMADADDFAIEQAGVTGTHIYAVVAIEWEPDAGAPPAVIASKRMLSNLGI